MLSQKLMLTPRAMPWDCSSNAMTVNSSMGMLGFVKPAAVKSSALKVEITS